GLGDPATDGAGGRRHAVAGLLGAEVRPRDLGGQVPEVRVDVGDGVDAGLPGVADDRRHAEHGHHQRGEEDEDGAALITGPPHPSNFSVAWLVSVTGIRNTTPLIASPALVIPTWTRFPGSALPSL